MAHPPAIDDETRLQALDLLRGFALFGMILVHFHQKMRLEASGLEDLIGWAVYIFVEQKAWGTFAFLFGAGFAILLRRVEARHAPAAAIYLRRLAALFVFGVIAELGFGFHILSTYASWGVVLFGVRRWSTKALLALAVVAVIARPFAGRAMDIVASRTGSGAVPPARIALQQDVDAAAEHGTYRELLAARSALFAGTTPGGWLGLLPDANLALFVIGLLAVRHRVFDEPLRHTRLIAGWMIFGVVSWLFVWVGWPQRWGLGLIQDQWLCFTYIGALVLLLARRPAWTVRLAAVGLAGRMALTNYLVQAVVLDVLSSSYGAGMKLRPLAYVPAAGVLFAVEAGISMAWLRRFRFGPLEWLWRVITYWQVQPLRRGPQIR